MGHKERMMGIGLALVALIYGCVSQPQPCYDIELNPRTGMAIVIDHCRGQLAVRQYNPAQFSPTTSTTLPAY